MAPEIGVKLGRIAVLALLVVALGIYVWRVELPKAEQEAEGTRLVDVQEDAIDKIDLTFPDRHIVLAKQDGHWRLEQPLDAPADESAVKGLLTALTTAKVSKTLDGETGNLAVFGLDTGTPTVVLTVGKDATAPIQVGKGTQIGGKVYVRRGDGPVMLVASPLKVGLDKQVKDLRDKQIMSFTDDQVERIDVTPADGPPSALVRKDRDAWVVEPGDHVADPTEVRTYLASLRSARAVDFPADVDTAQAGLDTPRLTVTATLKDGAPAQTLLLGGEHTDGSAKQTYVKRADQPTIYALGEWSWRALAKDAAQFRDKTLLGFAPERVGRVTIERKTGIGATLTRTPTGWSVEGGDATAPVRGGAITRLLDDLRDLRGSAIVAEPPGDLGPFGLDAPDLRFTLVDTAGKSLGTVLLARVGEEHYGMREGGPTVFAVRDYMYTRLDKQAADFRGPETVAPAPEGAGLPPGMAIPGLGVPGADDEDPDAE
ncbi:MAG: DUF4340 domain-containing protein [bacterium]|nr:DUF4340 domain-containing protein [bacterium]